MTMLKSRVLTAALFSVIVVLAFCVNNVFATDLSASEFQKRFLNKEVVVRKPVWTNSVPSNWRPFNEQIVDGKIEYVKVSGPSPDNIYEKNGIVVAVVDENKETTTVKDLFGKYVPASGSAQPQFNVIVKMKDDGQLVGIDLKNANYDAYLLDAALAAATAKKADAILAKLIGQYVYPVRYTKFLPADTTAEGMGVTHASSLGNNTTTGNLVPLKVLDAMRLKNENGAVLKVELPDKQVRLVYGDLNQFSRKWLFKAPDLMRMGFDVLDSLPKVPARVLSAIKEGSVVTGMGAVELSMSWGYPDKTNDYGKGGSQLIYGSHYIYVRNNIVTDIQSIAR